MSRYPSALATPVALDPYETSSDSQSVEQTLRNARERKSQRAWDEKSKQIVVALPASPTETLFRHSGWNITRQRVLQALRDTETTKGRRQRFIDCGAGCRVLVKAGGQEAKLSARYCRDRFCVPCMKARARVICGALREWCDGDDPLMITLTLRASDRSVKETLTHLMESFARLREQDGWRSKIRAGAYCIEITRGAQKTHWHVHLHAICLGDFYTQSELSDQWRRASNGSFIVHVCRASKSKKGIEYASEYASKGWSSECLEDPAWIADLLDGLHGRRLFGTFGGWRGRKCELDAEPIDGYRDVGNLVEIVHHAARGAQWAIGICKMIGVAVISDAGCISFVRLKRGAPAPGEHDLSPSADT